MKRLLFASLALLAACNQAPSLSPEQAKVEAFIKKQADDPASYQSVRWGTMKRWEQRDLDSLQAIKKAAEQKTVLALLSEDQDALRDARALGLDAADLRLFTRDVEKHLAQSKEIRLEKARLQASKDTTYRGTSLWHTFRLKNKFGALVLDSANFLLHPDGKIEVEKKSPAA